MPQFSRHATIDWSGPLLEGGKGDLTGGSGAFSLPVNFPARIGDAGGVTSPEELIAAAHATCYAMVINNVVGKMGGAIAKTHVTCTVTADAGPAGIKIVTSKLELTAQGLTGVDPHAFPQVAQDAEGKCPVSNALRGSVAITVEAKVS
ncbi:MAG: OsmC family peroxiredoxin [Acidobacteriota bacterium]